MRPNHPSMQPERIEPSQNLNSIIGICEWIGIGRLDESTTIDELDDLLVCHNGGTDDLRQAFGDWFNVKIPRSLWDAFTHPVEVRTIADVAELLSQGEIGLIIPPIGSYHDDDTCATAVFSALRQAMISRGEKARRILPSTPLAPYLGVYGLIPEVIKICGAAAPKLTIECGMTRSAMAIMQSIAIVLSCSSIVLLVGMGVFSHHQPSVSVLTSFVLMNLLALPLGAIVERASGRLSVAGYDTFFDLSTEIARTMSTMSETQLKEVPGCRARDAQGVRE